MRTSLAISEEAISRARVPLRRTTANPPWPGGVAKATMVSSGENMAESGTRDSGTTDHPEVATSKKLYHSGTVSRVSSRDTHHVRRCQRPAVPSPSVPFPLGRDDHGLHGRVADAHGVGQALLGHGHVDD